MKNIAYIIALLLLASCAPQVQNWECVSAPSGFVLDREKYAPEVRMCRPVSVRPNHSISGGGGTPHPYVPTIAQPDTAVISAHAGPDGASAGSVSGDAVLTAHAGPDGTSAASSDENGGASASFAGSDGASVSTTNGSSVTSASAGEGGASVSSVSNGRAVSVHAGPGGVSNSAAAN